MKKIIFLLALTVSLQLQAQRMLVLPDTPTFANQNRGVWVFRIADNLPYYSNGIRWVANTGGLSPQTIHDSLTAYNSRVVTSFNGVRGPVKGVDSVWFTNSGSIFHWRYNGLIYSQTITGGGAGSIYSVFGRTGDITAQSGDYSSFYQPIGNYITDADTLNKWIGIGWLPTLAAKQNALTLTTTGSSGAATLTGNTLNIPQYTGGGGGSGGSYSITENKNYYNGEFIVGATINTSTGAITRSGNQNISDYLPIEGGTGISISVPDYYPAITIYGWTYDSLLNPIAEIRSNSLISTKLKQYDFTTPSNARYICLYTKYDTVDVAKSLRIKSIDQITYNSPITPDQFSGSKSAPIQAAIDFARFTTSPVVLRGKYLIDSSLIVYSGTTLIIDNATLKLDSLSKTNIIRNEAVKYQGRIFSRGNRNVKIIGIGSSTIEGSNSMWGSDSPTGVGGERWRSIAALFANVHGLELNGITFKNTNAWAICLEQVSYSRVQNIIFKQDSSHWNQDGLNIRRGSNNIVVQNIRGVTTDDIVALTNLKVAGDINILGDVNYMPYKNNLDIEQVHIRNIQRDTSGSLIPSLSFYQSGILMLCEDGYKIHDVSIDGVTGPQQIQIGFSTIVYYETTPATVNDMYNITVTNSYSNIRLDRPIKNSSFVNVPSLKKDGSSNVVFANGSKKVYRKYFDGTPEYYDSTYAGNTYYEQVSDNQVTGFRIKSNNVGGFADIKLESPQGKYGMIRMYNDGVADYFYSKLGVLSSKGLLFISDVDVASGGTSNMTWRVGGNTSSNEMLKLTTTGLGINLGASASPSLKLDIKSNINSFDGVQVTNTSASGSSTFNLINNATENGFFRMYGSSFVLPHLQNKLAFGSSKGVAIISNAGGGSGGSDGIEVYGGGYDLAALKLKVNSAGVIIKAGTVPSTSTSTGEAGQIAWDANYFYLCIATNTWTRVALAW